MSLLNDISNELVQSGHSLETSLLKTKVLASKLGNVALLKWVNAELEGYRVGEVIPKYRSVRCRLVSDYINGGYKVTGQDVGLDGFSPKIKERLTTISFDQSVSNLESLSVSKDVSAVQVLLPPEMVEILSNNVRRQGNPYLQILSVRQVAQANSIKQVLGTLRSMVLDFVLKLGTEFGEQIEISDLKKTPDVNTRITNIMKKTIIKTGDGSVVNTGKKAKINVKVTIAKNSIEDLKAVLTSHGVPHENVSEIVDIVKSEKPMNGRLGTNASNWIQKMVGKTIDGSWNIGTGTAAGILADALSKFFGLN